MRGRGCRESRSQPRAEAVQSTLLRKGMLTVGQTLGLCIAAPALAVSAPAAPTEVNPVAPFLVTLVVLLLAAKLGGDLFERLGQPAVLGELLCGVVLGNLDLLGYDQCVYLKEDPALRLFAELGVILLLFEVGLQSSVGEMLSVGVSATLVATLGVILPILLGFGASWWFYPSESTYVHVFIGATLCATSVGITARVLQDLGRIRTRESRIVLGAAVVDDVLGLIVLATLTGALGAAAGGEAGLSVGVVGAIAAKAVGFVGGAIVVGYFISPPLLRLAARFRVRGMLLTTALLMCFLLAYFAEHVGLAPIVGAFAAGLIIEERHVERFRQRGEPPLADLMSPLVTFLAPLFFVRMGVLVELRTLGDVAVLGFAATLTVAAIVGKQVCSLGVVERGLDRLSIGLGMIPRGEVGLIFANIGAATVLGGQAVISAQQFSAVVIMVMITTLVTPPLLRWSLNRGDRRGK
jgi:Kef-type K+ transport system membrane component KefB